MDKQIKNKITISWIVIEKRHMPRKSSIFGYTRSILGVKTQIIIQIIREYHRITFQTFLIYFTLKHSEQNRKKNEYAWRPTARAISHFKMSRRYSQC